MLPKYKLIILFSLLTAGRLNAQADNEIQVYASPTSGRFQYLGNQLRPRVTVPESPGKGTGISPQFKTVYTINGKVGIGFEYYSGIGTFKKLLPGRMQEHLIGPMIDLYVHPM